MSRFQRATKEKAKLRLAFIGPAGSGKTFSSLLVARELGERVALIDTERGSASKYADEFAFDALDLEHHDPDEYIAAIKDAAAAGYDVLVIDSLSHAWAGRGGILEFVDNQAKRQSSGGSFSAWRDATPKHNALVDALLTAPLHIIATMRSKMEYVQERDSHGKTVIRKVGLQPVQRDGLEYEFDVVADLDQDNHCAIGKTRCTAIRGKIYSPAGAELAEALRDWLTSGADPLPDRLIAAFEACKGPDDKAAYKAACAAASDAYKVGKLRGDAADRVQDARNDAKARVEPDPFGEQKAGDANGGAA